MIAEFSVYLPDVEHLTPKLARIVSLLQSHGLEFSVGATSTSIRGESDEIFTLLRDCYDLLDSEDQQLLMNITIIKQRQERHNLADSIAAVQSYKSDASEKLEHSHLNPNE